MGVHAPGDGGRHLLGLDGLPRERIVSLLERTRTFDDGHGCAMRGDDLVERRVCNLFFEDSTRTRLSFSMAAANLGGTSFDLASVGSSASKGESVVDTARVAHAMGFDALVVRSASSGAAETVARALDEATPPVAVINAGDGMHEHPTQGLLDIYALARAAGREDFDLSGLTVAIVGDLISSRVARSDIFGMTELGARVVCVGPRDLAPPDLLRSLGAEVSDDFDAVLAEADAVQMLRVQFERHTGGPAIESLHAYRERYSLTTARAARMKPDAVVMHPGPVNRGLEIEGRVADDAWTGYAGGGGRSIILRQVSAGVLVRMAVLADAIERL